MKAISITKKKAKMRGQATTKERWQRLKPEQGDQS